MGHFRGLCGIKNDHAAQSQLSLLCCVEWSRCSKPAESRFRRWAKWLYDANNDIIGSVHVYMWGQLIYQEFCVAFTTNMHIFLFNKIGHCVTHKKCIPSSPSPFPSSTFLCMIFKEWCKAKKEGKGGGRARLATMARKLQRTHMTCCFMH